MTAIANGIVGMLTVFANSGTEITNALVTLLQSIITAIRTVGNDIIDTVIELADGIIGGGIDILKTHGPDLIDVL